MLRSAPVEGVVLHPEVVPGEVPGRVAQVVVLVPQHPLTARGSGHDFHLNGQFDRGGQLPSHLRLQKQTGSGVCTLLPQ